MSLLRLLTTGKSLVDVGSTETRYRVTTQRLLPKFGPAKNPFRGGVRPASGAATVAGTASSEPTTAPLAPRPVAAGSGRAPVALGRFILAVRKAARQLWQRVVARLSSWKARLVERFARPPRTAAKPPIPRFDKPAVQGELSLDRVKVVRNDLSDADLEIVPAKAKAEPALPAAEPAGAAGGDWGQMASRLFRAGKT